MVHVVQLAVVVCAGGRAEVQVRPAQELGLDLAGPPARLLAVGLHRGRGRGREEEEERGEEEAAALIKSVLAKSNWRDSGRESTSERECGGHERARARRQPPPPPPEAVTVQALFFPPPHQR